LNWFLGLVPASGGRKRAASHVYVGQRWQITGNMPVPQRFSRLLEVRAATLPKRLRIFFLHIGI